jgi:hypothetical protein|tara:strand:+ start:1924 stop:2190 length:267 start_codon:yes stop_codon:yes gene_type:complete
MIPAIKAGTIGLRILKTLYKGKKKIGKGSKFLADKAAKEGFAGTSKVITGVSKKAHKASRFTGQAIKENPKLSSFVGGIGTYKFFDDE